MENLFFDTGDTSLTDTAIKVTGFLLATGVLLFFIYLAFAKLLFQKNKHRKEINLRLALLWAIFACFTLFNAYIFVFFYMNGIDSLHWSNAKFYLRVLPQLFVYIGLPT
ncbi:MAG: hypothetical protein CRN43_16345, partial [Candidatus Nephrothrix sp. EaCA]